MSKYGNTHLYIKSYKGKITVMIHEPWWLKGHTINTGVQFKKGISEMTAREIKVINKKNWANAWAGALNYVSTARRLL